MVGDRTEQLDKTLAHAAGLFSLGCAAIHAVVTPPHFEEYALFGWFFLVVTSFQLTWGLLVLVRPASPLLALGAAVNLGIVAVWLWSRTVGLPFGPEAGETQVVGLRDGTSTAFEFAMVLVLGVVLLRRGGARSIIPARRAVTVTVLVAITVAALTAVAIAAPDEDIEGRRAGHALGRVTVTAPAR